MSFTKEDGIKHKYLTAIHVLENELINIVNINPDLFSDKLCNSNFKYNNKKQIKNDCLIYYNDNDASSNSINLFLLRHYGLLINGPVYIIKSNGRNIALNDLELHSNYSIVTCSKCNGKILKSYLLEFKDNNECSFPNCNIITKHNHNLCRNCHLFILHKRLV